MAASIVSPCLRYFSYSTFLYYPKYPLHSLFPFFFLFSFFSKKKIIIYFYFLTKASTGMLWDFLFIKSKLWPGRKKKLHLIQKIQSAHQFWIPKKKVTIKKIITITVDLLNISVEQSNTGAFSFFPIKYSLRTKMQVKTLNDPLTLLTYTCLQIPHLP